MSFSRAICFTRHIWRMWCPYQLSHSKQVILSYLGPPFCLCHSSHSNMLSETHGLHLVTSLAQVSIVLYHWLLVSGKFPSLISLLSWTLQSQFIIRFDLSSLCHYINVLFLLSFSIWERCLLFLLD